MRKILLILGIFVLFCGTVYADINPRIDSLRTAAFEQSLVPDAGNAL